MGMNPSTTRSKFLSLRDGVFRRGRKLWNGFNISLDKPTGLTQIKGENGAGKTTLLEILAGVYPLRSGSLVSPERLFYAPESVQFFTNESVIEHLYSVAALWESSKKEERLSEAIRLFSLEKVKGESVFSLSTGQARMVSLAASLMADPDVVLWDEPFNGLDSLNCERLIAIIEGQRKLRHLVLVCHRELDINPDSIVAL